MLNAQGQMIWRPGRRMAVHGAHLEIKVPLVSERNARTGLAGLNLDFAGGVDKYNTRAATLYTVGTTDPVVLSVAKPKATNPMVGMNYSPIRDLMFRGDYSEATSPPLPSDIVRGTPILVFNSTGNLLLLDPRRGGEPIPSYLQTSGGNPKLVPEKAKSRSFGVVLAPRFLPGLRMSADFIRIDKFNNIVGWPGGAAGALANEAQYPDRVTRGPVPAGDRFGVGPVTGFDVTSINLARSQVIAYDYHLEYSVSNGFGAFRFYADATRAVHLRTQNVPGSSVFVENVGNNPESGNTGFKLRANAGLTWEKNEWKLGWMTRYYSDYRSDRASQSDAVNLLSRLNQGNGGVVPSQTYHDFFGSYSFRKKTMRTDTLGRLFAKTDIQVGIRNVFNRRGPYEAINGFYFATPSDPRLATYYITIKRSL
jgi:hypothetical protein